MSQSGKLAKLFVKVIETVDEKIGENNDYGEGIGPHNENDQIDALVKGVQEQGLFSGAVATAKSNAQTVKYSDGRSADIVVETEDVTEYCEAKLLRFRRANGQPSPPGFSKVFSPYQDSNPRSFIHDISKLAKADIQVVKTFLGLYYRPVSGAGSEITGEQIAKKFANDVAYWTNHTIDVDTVASFDSLQHPVQSRGAIIVWTLNDICL